MRWRLRACGGGLVFLVTACGGTVAGGDPTAGEQLRTTGAQRCKSACATLAPCDTGTSCDCACAPCPAGATDCTCAPCNCGGPPPPAKCEADCNDSVNQVLSGSPQCENQMLAVLDCVDGSQCQPGMTPPCRAEADALESCTGGSHASTTPPVSGPPPSNPGAVTCRGGSGSLGSQGGPPPPPGAVVCESGWDSCSDGRSYSLQCTATSTSDLSCACIVNGATELSFVGHECTSDPIVASSSCGWNLL
jgi:hypothetical protein